MTFETFMLFAITEFLLCLVPGPAVLCIVSQGMKHGTQSSMKGALGVVTANAVYFSLSAVGLGALLIASKTVYFTIKWAGAGYLIYLGLKMILFTHATDGPQKDERARGSSHRLFWQGLVTQLASPKAIIYFTALLPQFVTVEGSVPQQFLVLGLASILIEFPVLLMYGWLSATGRRLLSRRFHLSWLDKIAGTFLIGAGLKLALIRHT